MSRFRRCLASVIALALAAVPAVAATGQAAAPTGSARWPLSFLHVGPPSGPAQLPQIVDAHGRSVLLRGVDVNGLEDYWNVDAHPLAHNYPIDPSAYTHHRCPDRNLAAESMTVCWFDAGQWKRFGYNVIRLGLSWSLLEPRPGHLDRTYLARIAQVVGWAHRAGVYVILDMHQDAWSKYLYTPKGGSCPPPLSPVTGWHEADGAPAWASAHSTPACQFQKREFNPAVIEDFQRFWSDLPAPDGVGLQEHFAHVVAVLAKRFVADPTVVGYDLFNEPSPGTEPPGPFGAATLFPFYAKVIATVRRDVPQFRQLFFLEPDITRDVTDASTNVVPWSAYSDYPNVVYTPHIYTRVFTVDAALAGAFGTPTFLPMSEGYQTSIAEARAMGMPVWVGEFGNNVHDDATQLAGHYDAQDAAGIGSGLWVWKADVDRKASVAKEPFSVLHQPFGRGVPFPSRIVYTSRAYPVLLAGTLTSMSYDAPHATFDLTATSAAVHDRRHATVVFVPARATGRVVASGARVVVVPAGHGNRLAWVYPTGGSYRVRVLASR